MSIKDLNPAVPGSNDNAGLGDDEIRALKAALQACFPELEGQISNASGTGDPGDTNPPDAATFSGLFDRVNALEAGSAGLIPVGGIMMWSGLVADIPSGWAICDGGTYNGAVTPDLRGRFVVGAADPTDSQFDPGDAGGDAWKGYGDNQVMETAEGGDGSGSASINLDDHVIAGTDLPDHEHYLFQTGAGSNTTHPGTGFAGHISQSHPSSDDRRYVLSEAPGEADQGRTGKVIGAVNAGDLTLSHTSQDITISDIAHKHDYAPRYMALAYIMYVGVAP